MDIEENPAEKSKDEKLLERGTKSSFTKFEHILKRSPPERVTVRKPSLPLILSNF